MNGEFCFPAAGPEYFYPEAGPRFDDEYVTRPVRRWCRKLGARTVLDIGCGNGALAARLVADGVSVTGLEPSSSGVDVASRSVPGARFVQQGVEDGLGALRRGSFDVAVSVEVIEHLVQPRALTRLAHAALRPGGHLILTTPYHGYLKNLVISLVGGWDRHHDPLWDGGHVKFWSRRTLTQLLEESAFRVRSAFGVGRLPGLWKSLVVVAQRVP